MLNSKQKLLKSIKNLYNKMTGKTSKRKEVYEVIDDLADNAYTIPSKLFNITDITAMTDEQVDALKCGDIVVKKTGDLNHTYIVTYKEEKHGICMTYFAAGYLETVSYDYTEGHWVYNSTDVWQAQA